MGSAIELVYVRTYTAGARANSSGDAELEKNKSNLSRKDART